MSEQPQQLPQSWPLGIDVAKEWVDVALLFPAKPDRKPKQKRFSNTIKGHAALLAWCQQAGAPRIHACMEATGRYWEALATYLHDQGQPVSVVNPKAVHHKAKSKLARDKTDQVDATVCAEYCRTEHPRLWSPPAPELRELQCLMRRLESLDEQRQMERNRLAAGELPELVVQSLRAHLVYLDAELKTLKAAIFAHLEQHPELRAQRDLLVSAIGFGTLTAAWLLAELPPVAQFPQARQVSAYAGMSPQRHDSGKKQGGRARLCKIGSGRIRKALYFPALTALQHDPAIQAWAERLRERGKSKMVIVGAVMRKLLHLAYGILKHGKPYDPEWERKRAAAA